jgi:hypothetical protein
MGERNIPEDDDEERRSSGSEEVTYLLPPWENPHTAETDLLGYSKGKATWFWDLGLSARQRLQARQEKLGESECARDLQRWDQNLRDWNAAEQKFWEDRANQPYWDRVTVYHHEETSGKWQAGSGPTVGQPKECLNVRGCRSLDW